MKNYDREQEPCPICGFDYLSKQTYEDATRGGFTCDMCWDEEPPQPWASAPEDERYV